MNSSVKIEPDSSCEFQENLRILRQIPMMTDFPLEAHKLIAYLCVRETFKTGDFLFRKGDDDGQAFYVLTGRCALQHHRGEVRVQVREYGPEEFIGGLCLVGEMRRLFSLCALTDMQCLVLQREKFTRVMGQFPEITSRILRSAVRAIDAWEERFLADVGAMKIERLPQMGVSLI